MISGLILAFPISVLIAWAAPRNAPTWAVVGASFVVAMLAGAVCAAHGLP